MKSAIGTEVRQYSRAAVLAVWLAAAAPMGVLAWIVTPAVAGPGATDRRSAVTLIVALTVGLIWQCVLVVALVAREQRSLRWPVLRDALWLTPPSNSTGRRGGRLWLWTVPFVVGFAALQFVPLELSGPSTHDFGKFLSSAEGHDALRGNWGLYVLILVLFLFNTVLGEELLFRGLLLPRMRGAFGRADWIVNSVIFGLYHVHQPWSILVSVLAGLLFAYPSRRFRSAWLGITVHSAQSVVFAVIALTIVVS
ncbi:CPBP family intramembrane glutamic endopeptidase [Actinocrispum wychmicini]|uniref:CAAX prenyl protease-like protein n=1 Tax=Actinocrispum wychmicini TaxID=1213861 RepID=A0A4R2K097_9PSEU|nr:CPBP family intramembrane glutamic endopeptidase [Actinocrispum wychmicini]TCO59745.1 CAAX prenyl protease-like protein [Actinocrispum wychmicini]